MYGFRIKKALNVVGKPVVLNKLNRFIIRQNAFDAVAFANVKAKI